MLCFEIIPACTSIMSVTWTKLWSSLQDAQGKSDALLVWIAQTKSYDHVNFISRWQFDSSQNYAWSATIRNKSTFSWLVPLILPSLLPDVLASERTWRTTHMPVLEISLRSLGRPNMLDIILSAPIAKMESALSAVHLSVYTWSRHWLHGCRPYLPYHAPWRSEIEGKGFTYPALLFIFNEIIMIIWPWREAVSQACYSLTSSSVLSQYTIGLRSLWNKAV